MDELRTRPEQLHLDIEGDTKLYYYEEDLLIETAQTEGYVSEQDNEHHGCPGYQPDADELIEEGFVRELISKIQTMRKEAGL